MPEMPGMQMGHHVSGMDVTGAILLLLWAVAMWAAVVGLWYANRTPGKRWVFRASAVVITIGIVGQIGHLQEHVAQAGYWIRHPNDPAWMTPWGSGLAKGFGQVDTSHPTLGMEILHLVGNFIFLAGLAAVMVITRHSRSTQTRRWGKMGVWMQGIHGLEHLSLTLSVWFGADRAIGLSTWFGATQPGPGLSTYRLWWHFIANVMGSYIFSMALYHLWRERAVVEAAYRLNPTAPVNAGSRKPSSGLGDTSPQAA
ncbi:DUF6008 family protein [Actinacidiphila acididurans]|uniref:Cytochrome b561 bacterial/Ni-hydrogenase domain-containing protein n=1 Tax=Actinacidiphila acididurans TaxID=2784346 RepID=A0ABS2TM06_9ACTN|nr:DUF6008 family protein [Actinacidiphila acididurans]MBM9504375.1 hypothetical protein [Actinacidiphila acididurans]